MDGGLERGDPVSITEVDIWLELEQLRNPFSVTLPCSRG